MLSFADMPRPQSYSAAYRRQQALDRLKSLRASGSGAGSVDSGAGSSIVGAGPRAASAPRQRLSLLHDLSQPGSNGGDVVGAGQRGEVSGGADTRVRVVVSDLGRHPTTVIMDSASEVPRPAPAVHGYGGGNVSGAGGRPRPMAASLADQLDASSQLLARAAALISTRSSPQS